MIQLQVINEILNTKDTSLILLNNLSDIYFSDFPNEFNYIKGHIDQYGNVPDKVTFLDKFPDFQLLDVNESQSFLMEELSKDYKTRFLAKTFNKIRELLQNGKTEEAMSLYTHAKEDAVSLINVESFDLLNNKERYDSYVEKCKDFSRYYVKTGFDELDALIGGWDRLEELATISARPGIGKSWILLKVAKAAAEQGLRVGIYSGEMSEQKVGYRFDTLVVHISNSSLMRGNEDIQANYKQYIDTLSTRFKGCVKVLTPNMINGPAGVTALRAFIEKENLDILCVDQHSLLEDDRKAKNPVERASNISKDLKNLQVMKKIPIIAVSQQNRASTENGITTANIAQSDRISQDSTILLFIEQKDSILSLNLVKARDSVNNKKLHYIVDFDKGVFQFMPEEQLNAGDCEDLRKEFEYEVPSGENVF